MEKYIDYIPSSEEELVEGEPLPVEHPEMPPQVREEESPEIGIIRELSQTRKVLEQIRMEMKGYFWDHAEKKYVKQDGMEPLMNDKGISKYLSIIAPFVSDLTTFSNYKSDEINKYVNYICKMSIPTIYLNYKEYGIQSKSDLKYVCTQLFIYASGAFRKAVGAGDRNVIRGTITESMMTRQGYPAQYPQRERGFLSKINPFVK